MSPSRWNHVCPEFHWSLTWPTASRWIWQWIAVCRSSSFVADDERSQSLKRCVDPLESSLVAHFEAIELAFDVTHVGLQTIEARFRLRVPADEEVTDLAPDIFRLTARTPRTSLWSQHRLIVLGLRGRRHDRRRLTAMAVPNR